MLWERILRAIRLDTQVYDEVEADETATGQATLVVVLSSLAAGLAGYDEGGLLFLVGGTLAALLSWAVWSYVTYFVGVKLLPTPATEATHGQLLRTLGFASAPGLIRVVGILPGLGWVVNFVAAVWMLVAMIVAVRQALDYESTARAVGVCLVGWLIQLLILGVAAALFGIISLGGAD